MLFIKGIGPANQLCIIYRVLWCFVPAGGGSKKDYVETYSLSNAREIVGLTKRQYKEVKVWIERLFYDRETDTVVGSDIVK